MNRRTLFAGRYAEFRLSHSCPVSSYTLYMLLPRCTDHSPEYPKLERDLTRIRIESSRPSNP